MDSILPGELDWSEIERHPSYNPSSSSPVYFKSSVMATPPLGEPLSLRSSLKFSTLA